MPHFYFDDYTKDISKGSTHNNRVYLASAKSDSILIKGFTDSESFNIGVTHDFKQLNGFSGIGHLKDVVKKGQELGANIMSTLSTVGEGLSWGAQAIFQQNAFTDWYTNHSDAIDRFRKTVNEYLIQPEIDSADAYMYIFNGTKISIPTRFTQYLLTDSYKTDIEDQVRKIFDVLIGDFYTDPTGFVGYTKAPHNFETSLSGLKGTAPEGTFTMYYGKYRFPGVVVSSIDIDVSKTQVNTQSGSKPLYISISYGLTPVVKYTKKHITEWFGGDKYDES